ncbi:hypothetical protein HanIR_Chr15g0735121 [Helianthus annuus]|nr:hypothetical protein HanIR_Chr15g0735121 [Helianthus annuus]
MRPPLEEVGGFRVCFRFGIWSVRFVEKMMVDLVWYSIQKKRDAVVELSDEGIIPNHTRLRISSVPSSYTLLVKLP